MSGRAGGRASGVGRRPRFTFWLTFSSKLYVTFILQWIAYLVGMKRRTNRCVTCKKANSHFVHYVLIFPDVRMPKIYLLVNLFSKFYVTFILQRIAFMFGRDKEEDQ